MIIKYNSFNFFFNKLIFFLLIDFSKGLSASFLRFGLSIEWGSLWIVLGFLSKDNPYRLVKGELLVT